MSRPSPERIAYHFLLATGRPGNPHLERFANWLRFSMSLAEAKETLGFPSGSVPSPQDILKSYKTLAKQHHPDHGGSLQKMVAINVAKDILLGKARPTGPRPSPSKSDEEIRREEKESRRSMAIQVINFHSTAVGKAIALSFKALDLQGWKLDIAEFIADEFIPALDKIQDMIDDSKTKNHPDMRKADTLCASLSNKAMRTAKRYRAFQARVEKEQKSGGVTYSKMVDLYADAKKFLAGFSDLFQESRNLRGFLVTSEHLPVEWDDIYHRPHSVLDSFASSAGSGYHLQTHGLEAYEKGMLEAVKAIGSVVAAIDPAAWASAPDSTEWKYPEDFVWAQDKVAK